MTSRGSAIGRTSRAGKPKPAAGSGALDAERLQRLIAAGRTLVSELDVDALLERLLVTAAEVTGARYAALGILDEDLNELERFLTHGVDQATRRAIGDLPRGRGILGVLIDDPRPLRLANVGDDPRSYGFPAGHPPMETFLGVPVLIRGQAWGNLYLTEKRGGEPFTAADEEAAVVLAEWAGIAIANARLYHASESRRDELERAVRRLEATTAIARAIDGETELQRVLELIVERGRALVEARGVTILLREPGGLAVAATVGDVPDDALAADAAASALVPLVFRGQSLGVLAAFGLGGPAGEQEALLMAIAASAATAVATARSVEADRLRHSLAAAEAERSRWARELHDETLQGLGGLRMMVSAARRRDDADGMRAAMESLLEQIAREIDGLRGLIRELRPAALDELGAGPAVKELGARIAEQHGVEVETAVALCGRRSPEVETALYRIIQEALTNAVKHADATRIAIEVEEVDGVVHLAVADDGDGFDPEAPNDGFGLSGMRERVELLGGELAIASSADGTRVTAALPLRVET